MNEIQSSNPNSSKNTKLSQAKLSYSPQHIESTCSVHTRLKRAFHVNESWHSNLQQNNMEQASTMYMWDKLQPSMVEHTNA